MVPTAAAVMASSPIKAPVGTTICPPCFRANSIRSSFSRSAPTLSTTAVLPRDTTGETIERTSLLGAHSMMMSAASANASIGIAAGTLASLSSHGPVLVDIGRRYGDELQPVDAMIQRFGDLHPDRAETGNRHPRLRA